MATFQGGTNPSGVFVGGGVAYPPARSRPQDDIISASALDGFADFFVDQPGNFPNDLGDLAGEPPGSAPVTTCADMNSGCHALPLGADHNSATLAGFDVPTMRGMTDRFLQFSIGITNPEEALQDATNGEICVDVGLGLPEPPCFPSDVPWDPDQGFEENGVFSAAFVVFNPVYGSGSFDMFQMFEEASTGFSGAVGRQVTLSTATLAGCNTADACGAACATMEQLCALEAADANGFVNLRGKGTRNGNPHVFSRLANGNYAVGTGTLKRTRAGFLNDVQSGVILVTLTGHLRVNVGTQPQPLLSVNTTADGNGTNPDIPLLPGDNPMTLAATDVHALATVLVNGQAVAVNMFSCASSFPCTDALTIELAAVPSPDGLYLLQVQNPAGLFSNELPICVGTIADCDGAP